jgi:hypothetical protein
MNENDIAVLVEHAKLKVPNRHVLHTFHYRLWIYRGDEDCKKLAL